MRCGLGTQGIVFEQLYTPILIRGGNLSRLLIAATPLAATPPSATLPTIPATDLQGVELDGTRVQMLQDTMYSSTNQSFPVLDSFIVHGAHLVALQFTVGSRHPPTGPAIGQLVNSLKTAFGAADFDSIKTWSIVYVQRPGDRPISQQQVASPDFHLDTPAQYIPSHLVPVGKAATKADVAK